MLVNLLGLLILFLLAILFGWLPISTSKMSDSECAGSMEKARVSLPRPEVQMPVAAEQTLFPTPPLPAT